MNKKLLSLMLSGFIIFSTTACDSLLGQLPSVDNSNSEYPSTTESIQPSTSEEQEDVVTNQYEKIYPLANLTGYEGSYVQWVNSIKNDTIVLAVIDNSVQWKYKSDSQWTKLVDLEQLDIIDVEDGRKLEYRVLNGYLQYRFVGEASSSWENLFQMNTSNIYDTITVTFNPNNGQASFTQPVIPGYNVKEPEVIENEGYIFDGWYYQGTEDLWKFDYFSTSKDITLEARWIAKQPETSDEPSIDKTEPSIDKTEPITVWATASEEMVIEEIIKDWNANHEIDKQFKIDFRTVAEGDCGMILSKDPSANGAPALFLCADDHLSKLVDNNCVSEITGESRSVIENNNIQLAVSSVTQNDKVWGYPVTCDNGYFMWYDKSQVDADTVGNLEALLARAKKLGKSVLMDVPNGWYANSFIMSPQACGLESLRWYTNSNNEKYYETTWDNEVGVNVSKYIANLLTPYYMDGTLMIGSNDMIQAGFASRTMIAAVSGTWMENILASEIGDDLAADKLPEYHIDGKAYQMASFGGSKVYCINKTKSQEEQKTAAALAELLTGKEGQLVRFEKRASLPCNKEAALDPRYTENVSIGGAAFVKQSAFACVQARTAEDRYWEVGKTIGQAYIDNYLNGQTWEQFLRQQMNLLRDEDEIEPPIQQGAQLYIIGSHWNNWDPGTIYQNKECTFKNVGEYYTLTVEITKEMIESWVGFKFICDNSWAYQLGMEDVNWEACNQAFKDLFPEGKKAYTESVSNRSNIVPTSPGVMVIKYYPFDFTTEYLGNGSTHTTKLVIEFYPK